MDITCAVCGQVNADDTQFCVNPSCGAYLPWDRTAGHPLPPQQPAGPAGQPGTPPPAPPAQPQPQPSLHRRAEQGQRTGARIELAQPALAVEPGQITDTQATIHNTGSRVERFLVRVSGPAAPWASVEPADITVYPGQPGVCTVRFAPPRQATASAGAWSFGVLADSQVTPGLQASAVGSVHLGGFRALSMTLEPGAARGGSRTRHTLVLDNKGNVPEQVRLTASDTEGLLRFEVPPGATVNPGRSVVLFKVRAQREWFGKPRRVPFHVVATPADGRPVSADGVRIVRPRLGVLPLVLAGALLAVLAGGVALNLGSSSGTSETGAGDDTVVAAAPSESPTKKKKASKSPTPKAMSPSPKPSPKPPPSPEQPPPKPKTSPTPQVDPAAQVLVDYRKSGGIAGNTDQIIVFGDNRARVTRRNVDAEVNLATDEMARIKAALSQLEIGTSAPEPEGADYITYELVVNGARAKNYNMVPPSWQPLVEELDFIIQTVS